MEDADVIELGSSDEELETSTKKVPKNKDQRKRIGQANTISLQVPIKVKNATSVRNPFSGLPKTRPKTTRPLIKNVGPHNINPMSVIRLPVLANGGAVSGLNPCTIVNQTMPTNGQNAKHSVTQSKSCLTKLPPGITVTRTGGHKTKRKRSENPLNDLIIKRQKTDKRSKKAVNPICQLSTGDAGRNKSDVRLENDTPIVLDDDDQGSEGIVDESMTEEVLNEDELTDTTPPIENILIEDSPVKPPVTNKLAQRSVGIEEIVIEDSPLKEVSKEGNQPKTPNVTKVMSKSKEILEPHSKKKLEFVKSCDESKCVVEKKVEPIKKDGGETIKKDENVKDDKVEKPADREKFNTSADAEKLNTSADTEKPNTSADEEKLNTSVDEEKRTMSAIEAKAALKMDDDLEFHPSYQRFVDLCLEMDKTSDMKKIVEKKVICYYKNVDRSFTSSQMFVDLVEEKVAAMKVHPNNLFLYIKDIVDELRVQRKTVKAAQSSSGKPAGTGDVSHRQKEKDYQKRPSQPEEDEEEADQSSNRKVRKLERALRKLNRAIQKLEEQEVDFDEEGDSAYLLADNAANCALELAEMGGDVVREREWKERYKARLVRVHAKLSKLTGAPREQREHIQLEPRPGHPPGPARRLQAWLRRRPAFAGAPLPFPDFHDVVQCVREANTKDAIGWNECQVMEEARDLFVRVGRKLQRRRQEREWRSVAGLLPPATDPAEESAELRSRLESNSKVAVRRIKEVTDRYADRQTVLRLEPQAVDDKEADKSENSGEEEFDEPRIRSGSQPGTSGSKDVISAPKDKTVNAEAKSPIAEDKDSSEKVKTGKGADNNDERMHVDEVGTKESDTLQEEKALEVEKTTQEEGTRDTTQEKMVENKTRADSAEEIIQGDTKEENKQKDTAEKVIEEASTKEVIQEESTDVIIEENAAQQDIRKNGAEEIIQKEAVIREDAAQEDAAEEATQKDSNEKIIQDVVKENIEEDTTKEMTHEDVAEENIQKEVDASEQQITVPVSDTDESNRILSSDNDADKTIDETEEITKGRKTKMEKKRNTFSKDNMVNIARYENQIPVPVSDSDDSNRILSSSDNDVNFVEKSSRDAGSVTKDVSQNNTTLPISKDDVSKKTATVNGKSDPESGVEIITSDRVESDIDELHLLKRVSGGRTDISTLSDSSVAACGSSQRSQNSQTSQNDDAVMDVDESSAEMPADADGEIIDLDKKALLAVDGDSDDDTDGERDSDVVITCFNLASTEDECEDYVGRPIRAKTEVKEEAGTLGREDAGSIVNIDSVESVTSEVVLLN